MEAYIENSPAVQMVRLEFFEMSVGEHLLTV